MEPTSAGPSNLVWTLGTKDRAGLLKDVGEGILVTGFIGGNSNGTTGDYSLGVQGFMIRGGSRAEPVGEMNIAGNMLDLMKRLAAVGNDPWPYGQNRTPTLVFEGPCSSRGCRADAVPSGGAVVAAAGAAQIRRDRTSSGTRLRRAG
jgi:predicted Zn-dependent protease